MALSIPRVRFIMKFMHATCNTEYAHLNYEILDCNIPDSRNMHYMPGRAPAKKNKSMPQHRKKRLRHEARCLEFVFAKKSARGGFDIRPSKTKIERWSGGYICTPLTCTHLDRRELVRGVHMHPPDQHSVKEFSMSASCVKLLP